MRVPKPVRPSQASCALAAQKSAWKAARTKRKEVLRRFVPTPHSLSHECHLQEAEEKDTSKKIAATRETTQNTS